MVDRAYGKVVPVAVAQRNMTAPGRDPDGTLLAEKNWMLAYMFMDGANNNVFDHVLKNISNDHTFEPRSIPRMWRLLCRQ